MEKKFIFTLIALSILIVTGCKSDFAGLTGATATYYAYEVTHGNTTRDNTTENAEINIIQAEQNKGTGEEITTIVLT